MTLSLAHAAVREAPPLTQQVHGPITYVAHCERDGIPFFGRAYVGYVPTGARVAEPMLRRMLQRAARGGERALAADLITMLQLYVRPAGVALAVHTTHECEAPVLIDEVGARTETTWRGRYRADPALRAEFLRRCASHTA